MIDGVAADAGLRRIFPSDPSLETMTTLPGTGALLGTRLQATADGSINALDYINGEILRYSRAGRTLLSPLPLVPTSCYSDFTIDPLTGSAYTVDFLNGG